MEILTVELVKLLVLTDHEEGASTFLWKVGNCLLVDMVNHPGELESVIMFSLARTSGCVM
jgi:hypothetical protein